MRSWKQILPQLFKNVFNFTFVIISDRCFIPWQLPSFPLSLLNSLVGDKYTTTPKFNLQLRPSTRQNKIQGM